MNIKSTLLIKITCLLLAINANANEEDEGPSNRIDFGNSYVQGQSIKSGAVYLMNRKKNVIESMLKKRETYREDILAEYPEYRDEQDLKDKYAESTTE